MAPPGRPRGEMGAVLPGWVSLGHLLQTKVMGSGERTCDISNSLGIGQRKHRAQGPRRQHSEREEHRVRHQDAGCKPQLDSSFAV